MKISEIIQELERLAPPSYQETYDNAALLTGDASAEATGALLSLDCTEEVVQEAIEAGCNLVICHHPIIFSGLKRLTGKTYVERTIIKAIKNDVAIYACHTNLDNVAHGVNQLICTKLGLQNTAILAPKAGFLKKLVTFVPATHHSLVLDAVFAAGAGHIGKYDKCSFNLEGEGTFRGSADSNPFIGKPGELSREKETRLEVLFESHREKEILRSLRKNHPYEEVAFDVYSLSNEHQLIGSGMTGEFETAPDEKLFLQKLKETFNTGVIKHTALRGKKVKKVAVCGGSGAFLLKNAIASGADAFVTSDFKYHEYFDVEGRLLLADIGHYESEQYTPEIFLDAIRKKFSTFAVRLSKINTNPVHYF